VDVRVAARGDASDELSVSAGARDACVAMPSSPRHGRRGTGTVWMLAFSPDGKTLAVTGNDCGRTDVWDLPPGAGLNRRCDRRDWKDGAKFGNPKLKAEIQEAFDAGRIWVRQVDVDLPPRWPGG
jgi:hypothetical protein